MKLVVEILDASSLVPRDGQGSASPFVEVQFDGQRQRTTTKDKDLSPVWNERLEFTVTDPSAVVNDTVTVDVYNDRRTVTPLGTENHHFHQKNFLGRIQISGTSIPFSPDEAVPQRYPLDKRSFFSRMIHGDINLKLYLTDGEAVANFIQQQPPPTMNLPFQPEPVFSEKQKNKNKKDHHVFSDLPPEPKHHQVHHQVHQHQHNHQQEPKIRTFAMHSHPPPQPPPVVLPPQQMQQLQRKESEYSVVETSPPLGGALGFFQRRFGNNKTSSTYDLVQPMEFLYVAVVKARDLPHMDLTGSLDPYVEVKIGNYKGLTKHMEKNQNPAWNQVFAFSREKLQSSYLEVIVKDKDIGKDDFVGRMIFDLAEVPRRVPPDSPLAPQWYRLEDKKGDKVKGEIMLAVWKGTQADEAYPDALHSDAAAVAPESISHTKSKVYFSPKLCYLRVHAIEAQDLVPFDKGRMPDTWVKVQLGNQIRRTRPSLMRGLNPQWNEELLFVAADPFEDHLVVTVEDRVAPNKEEPLGRVIIPLLTIAKRFDHKLVDPGWYNLDRPMMMGGGGSESGNGEKKKEVKFASKIQLRVCLDGGYHVLDESTQYSSDLRPTAKQLWKQSIGVLELGILGARNVVPLKAKSGKITVDAYCVAKYGQKWVRTRTLQDTLNPNWNEQYTWEVYDPCTVITIGVFDNSQLSGDKETRDDHIGKVRIRLSTLETDRVYTHSYPLLVLHPSSGLKKTGELHLALRFSCSNFVNMMHLYSKPLLPKMHYLHPLSVMQLDWLRHHAIQMVAIRLSRAEPPLRKEVVEYMLDVDQHMFSLRRSKANFHRIMSLLSGVISIGRWLDEICHWANPITTVLVHVLFLILVCYPELILPTLFLYLFLIGIWNYRFRPRNPSHMDTRLSQAERTHPDELDEEFDTFPTSKPPELVRLRYERLRSVAGRVQTVVGDLATQGERVQSILSWRDPRATAIFVVLCLGAAVFLYVTPFQVVAVIVGLFYLRHPRFRSKLPAVPLNFFRRLPAKTDRLI